MWENPSSLGTASLIVHPSSAGSANGLKYRPMPRSIAAAPVSFADRWRAAVSAGGDRPFLTFDDGRRTSSWTYAELDLLAARFAGHLVRLGLRPGGLIHLCLANSPAFLAAWLAAV